MSFIEVARVEIGGVPAFVAEEEPPVPVLGLTFRVGRVDETAATSGISHLVEHLILPARTGVPVDFNGTVDNLCTSLFASGDADELRSFVESTVALVRRPPLERLEVERRILLAEEAARPMTTGRSALGLRFGPNAAGLSGYDEYGLRRLAGEDVEAWTATRFTRESAALWLAGVPVDSLELDLADGGARLDPPESRAIDDLRTPAVYAYSPTSGICLAFLAERSATTPLALDAMADRLRDRLRYELGLTYGIETDSQPLSGTHTHLTITADVADELVPRWLDEAVGVLDDLAEKGPSEAWLEHAKAAYRRYDRDPGARSGWAAWCADWELVGRPFQSHRELVAEREAVTPADIAHAVAAARASLLVVGPGTTPVPAGFEDYPLTCSHRVSGRRHRPRHIRDRLRRQLREVELASAEEGLTYVPQAGTLITALYGRTAVCLRSAGERTLLTDDGFFLRVAAAEWTDGEAVLEQIDRGIPADRVVRVDEAYDARVEEVEHLARSTFRRTWYVSDELKILPAVLEEDESLLLLAQATRGWRLGLVAVTNRRFRFLYGDGTKHSFVAERDDLRVTRVRGSKLELDHDGVSIKLTDIEPKGKAEELADAIRAWAAKAEEPANVL